jgi:hypothetical protein
MTPKKMFNRTSLIPIQGEWKQFIILTQHFFHRLFQNDMVDFEDQMMERLIGILALLGFFCGLLSYGFLNHYGWVPDTGTSWIEKCAFITFCMLVTALVAVLEWDIIFPDARDYKNLYSLPIKVRTLFGAKFASLISLVGLFALSMIFFSTPIFVAYLPQWQSSNLFYLLVFALAHVISLFLAIFFAFFFNVFLMGILMALLGYKLFNRVSTYIRSLLLLGYVFLIVLYIRILMYGVGYLFPPEKLGGSISTIQNIAKYFPPLWFTDLYETLLGNSSLPFHGALNRALVGLVIMIFVFSLATGISYRRFLKKLGSVQREKVRFRKLRSMIAKGFDWTFLRNSAQRAVFHFYHQTLKASMFHKMRLTTYIAVGVGLILVLVVPKLGDPKSLFEINKTMLSVPLILSFFLVLGIRGIVNVPISLEANWIFQITEWENIRHYISGLRKGIIFLNLFPLFIVLFIFYSFIWDGMTAFYHCLYGLFVSVLVMEVFFLTFTKVPFACSYLPGKEKIQLFWIAYLFGFLAYINLMSGIELILLKSFSRSSFLMFLGIIFLIIVGIRAFQILIFYKKNSIKYEEEPEPVIVGLDYKIPKHKRRT